MSGYVDIPPVGDGHWKAPVTNLAALPATGNTIGDARVTKNTQFIYVWSGSAWTLAGGGSGGGGTPAAPNHSVQYNNGGAFGGQSNFIWTAGANTLTLSAGFPDWVGLQLNTTGAYRSAIEFSGQSTATNDWILASDFGNGGLENFSLTNVKSSNTPWWVNSTGQSGFLNTTPAATVDASAISIAILSPTTVTLTASDADPSIIGVCTGFYITDEYQYNNDSATCVANGQCSDPLYTDAANCTLNGGTWTNNTFTPGAGYPMQANGTGVTYTLYSHRSTPTAFYSTTGTTQSHTLAFDTDPGSMTTLQVDGSGAYTADGSNNFTYQVWSIYGSGLRSTGTAATVAFSDNSDAQPFSVQIDWAAPTDVGTLSQYLVYNPTTGTAQYTGSSTPQIIDDGSWPAFSDPGLSNMAFDVSWSAITNADFYALQTSLQGSTHDVTGLSFTDYGNPFLDGSPNPKGPVSTTAIIGDGISIFRNTKSTESTLEVHSSGSFSNSQTWYDSTGSVRAYMGNTGILTADLSPISGNITMGGTLSAGTVATAIINSNALLTTLTGSAGTAVCSEPFQGGSYKKVVVYLSGYTDTGTQTYNFLTSFAHTPYLYGLAAGVAGATVTTSSIKFTVTTQTGFVFAEGY